MPARRHKPDHRPALRRVLWWVDAALRATAWMRAHRRLGCPVTAAQARQRALEHLDRARASVPPGHPLTLAAIDELSRATRR